MSSFIGHGITVLAIGKGFSAKSQLKHQTFWLIILVLCAFAPDVDYLVKSLNSINNGGLRITHSVGFSLILPICGVIYLSIFDRKNIFWGGLQACLAGLSHLVLDTLVGSKNGDPLLYPLTSETFKLPFGILPSAGALNLSNYYFYRNLFIECGILVPTIFILLSFFGKLKLNKISVIISLVCLVIFLVWSVNLTR